MLGNALGEERGRITSNRVLSEDTPTVETSFSASGKLLGVDMTDMGTYVATMRPDGTLFGTGQGVIMTADGEGATWKGSGVGIFGAGGSISYRGALYYQSASAKLAGLNQVAAVFEYDVDGEGNVVGKTWEWK
jgi:hypothetical protein